VGVGETPEDRIGSLLRLTQNIRTCRKRAGESGGREESKTLKQSKPAARRGHKANGT